MNTDKLTALWLDMSAARRADWDAWEVLQAMDADLATYGLLVMAAWDRAALCAAERVRTLQAFTNAVKHRNRVAV